MNHTADRKNYFKMVQDLEDMRGKEDEEDHNHSKTKYLNILITSITVIAIYVMLLYVLPKGHAKGTAIDFIPTGKGELVTNEGLFKRNRWTIFAKNAFIGMVATTAAITGSWAANTCSVNVASPACWITFVAALVSGGLAYAMTQNSGSVASNAKREFIDFLDNLGYTQNVVNPSTIVDISQALTSVGLTFLGVSNITTSSLVKRDMFNATDNHNILIHWKSSFGSHAGSHMQQDWKGMLNDIVTDTNPGSLESTLRHTEKHTLAKRWNYFDVQWISWNYDNVNHDLAKQAAEDRQVAEEEYDSAVYEYFNNNSAWKYCLSVFRNDHVGKEETYDDLGRDNAVHGELYFNTYGGVDGYCNDNKDGAQCSGEACET